MGPDADSSASCEFSDKIPPRFNGHGNYASYREDVVLWTNLTTLPSIKHGPAIVGRLQGEAKTSAKTIKVDVICAEGGVEKILERLDKAYAVDKTNQLDADLADFLDYSWKKELSVEHFISGFHTRVDKISQLNLDDKLKGHLLLRQADLAYNEKHVVVGAASGSYEVQHISAALRNIYRTTDPTMSAHLASINTPINYRNGREDEDHNSENGGRGRGRGRGRWRRGGEVAGGNRHDVRPTFYSFKTSSDNNSPCVIIDTGACSSVVGKDTLDKVMRLLNLDRVEDTEIKQKNHRFGNYDNDQPSRFAVKMPFSICDDKEQSEVGFDVAFDVIDGDLPFLLGLPSLRSMGAVINHKYRTLSFTLNGSYQRLKLIDRNDHIFLPFHPEPISMKRSEEKDDVSNKNRKYYTRSGKSQISRQNSYYTPPRASKSEEKTAVVQENKLPLSSNKQNRKYYRPSKCPDAHEGHDGAITLDDMKKSTMSKEAFSAIDTTSATRSNKILDKAGISKLHLQLRHGTKTALTKYIRAAGLWGDTTSHDIEEVIQACGCRIAMPPKPHTKVGRRPPTAEPQKRISIDVIHLGGNNYLHVVDECTSWSEAGRISRKSMNVQIDVLRQIQFLRHGPPEFIRCDREYDNEEFRAFCAEHGTELVPVAANDHESNGLIENANRTLRSFFDRLRSFDKRTATDMIVAEAIYGKNLSFGSKKASAFQLLYGRNPRLTSQIDDNLPPPITVKENARQVAHRRVKKMLRSSIQKYDNITVGNTVAIWRDGSGWLFPARVTKVTPYYYEVVHNGRLKTSGINRTRLIETIRDNHDQFLRRLNNAEDSQEDNISIPNQHCEQPDDNAHDVQTDEFIGTPEDNVQNDQTDTHARTPTSTQPLPQKRIHPAEVRRLREETNTIIDTPLERTRSRTEAANNSPSMLLDNATGDYHSDPFNDTTTSSDSHSTCSDDSFREASYMTEELCHMISFLAEVADNPSESSATSKLTEQERAAAFQAELKKWQKRGAYTPVKAETVPKDANIVGSHVIYKRKLDLTPKARIVPWGHRDQDKDFLRGDAPSISLEVFHFILSLASAMKWKIGQMDIETAFLQALGFRRTIFVRPPREAGTPHILWKLELPAYGLTDSGRLWYLTSDAELIQNYGLTRSRLDYTLYYSVDDDKNLDFALAVQVDDYIYTGTDERMVAFEAFLSSTFDVGNFARGSLSLMGCEITQDRDYSVTLSQEQMLAQLDPQLLIDAVQPKGDEQATDEQATIYRHTIGKMLYIGRMSAPLILLHASMAATKLSDLYNHHLRSLAAILKRLKTQGATLHYISPPTANAAFTLDIISDGAMAGAGPSDTKGREGYIIFRRYGDIVHPIQWCARRLRRVARSSATVEILAAADAMSNGLYLQHLLRGMHVIHPTELTVDSTSLQSLSTSIKEPEERLNKVDLASIREAFDEGDLTAVHWCPGKQLLADPLTKDNPHTAALLLNALSTGQHIRPLETKTNLGQDAQISASPGFDKGRGGEN